MLKENKTKIKEVEINLPDGDRVKIPVFRTGRRNGRVYAEVKKRSSEKGDVTNGIIIRVIAEKSDESSIVIKGGKGIGKVTRKGLAVSCGEPAINPVPRRMIIKTVREVYSKGIILTVEAENGKSISHKTFNPRLGIIGGISILGTTGKVKPWDRKSFIDSMKCSISVAKNESEEFVILTPGSRGEKAFLKEFPDIKSISVILVGNEVGEGIKESIKQGFRKIVLAGHPGKLAKIANGNYNTHHSKSEMPFSVIRAAANKNNIILPEKLNTIEEIIQLRNVKKTGLFNDVAEIIADRCKNDFTYTKFNVLLYDMKGKRIGEYTEFNNGIRKI